MNAFFLNLFVKKRRVTEKDEIRGASERKSGVYTLYMSILSERQRSRSLFTEV